MNPHRVKTQEEVEAILRSEGYKPTAQSTGTGVIWHNDFYDKYIQVPNPLDGMYPDAILGDLLRRIKTFIPRPH